ncbi:MAG: sigma-70 family RNA polymerase sigma factor [Bacteroidales bacterium]|nr:sigma-70 family RNA polymerase sigma factor [Bacteroidales bacterium]
MTTSSDKDLVRQFKDENSSNYAFNLIVKKYQKKLYWHIRKILISHDDTDDALQNTFIKVFEAMGNFREDSSLYTWLYRIATNEALTALKKRRTKYFIPIGDVQSHLENTLTSDPHFDGDEAQMKLQQAILKLPEKQRIVFNMKYFDEMKYEDMAEILSTSVGSLKASYHHAVKKIKQTVNGN